MPSLPAGRSNSERCPGNLCAYVSTPFFREVRKESQYSLLHNDCDNCSSQSEAEHLCSFCAHLRLRHLAICLRDKLRSLRIELDIDNRRGSGISRIVSNKECKLCILLAKTIDSYFIMSKRHGEDENNTRANTKVSLALEQGYNISGLILELFAPDRYGTVEIAYCKTSEVARPNIESRINWPTVQQWIHNCTHHHHCTRSELARMPEGFRLIDVNNRKLISDFQPGSKLGGDVKFIALSYVWGEPNISRSDALLGSNKHELTTNGLGKMTLPKAIEDAITVCQQLNQCFLWVDRLCIQQDDDGPEKRAQINAMGDIYSSAEFTIIHASGTGMEDPISGVSTTREVLQFKTVVCGLELISGYPDIKVTMAESKWNSRGWTYQEAVLSRRKLFFTPFELWFECNDSYAPYRREEQCTRRRDGGILSPREKSELGQYRLRSFAESTTQFEDFIRHIGSYATRSLTYQSDILDAFLGILTTLYEGGRSIYGLPEADFDRALLWRCENNSMKRIDTISIPSWSWASVNKPATTPMLFWSHQGFLGTLIQWSYKDQNGELKTVRSENSFHSREKSDTRAQAHLLVAWWAGCIEPAIPEDVRQELQKCYSVCESSNRAQLHFIERVWGHIQKSESCARCESQIVQRWPCLEEVWKDIQKARNYRLWETQHLTTSPRAEDQLLIEKLRPEILLTRAQVAFFKLSMIESMTEQNGRYVLSERLYYAASRRIGVIWAAYVDALREVVDAKLETSQVDSLQCIGISLFSDESPAFGNQPAVNVLVIHHEEGSPFARRIGVGYIYLVDWIKADRMFKTIGLE